MNPPPGKLILFCGTNRGEARDCVDWAVDALCQGLDSPNLRILAGLEEPLQTFEVKDYALKAMKELEMELLQGDAAISAYAYDVIHEIIEDPKKMKSNLKTLCELCIAEDYQKDIYDFYTLRWAYDDLEEQEVQYYWEGADRSNIQEVVLKRCQDWITEYKNRT